MTTKSLNTGVRNYIKYQIETLREIRSGQKIKNCFSDYSEYVPEFISEQEVVDEIKRSWSHRWTANLNLNMFG